MNDNSTTGLVRRYFAAFQGADREKMEALLAADFTFTSPWDDHIDRATYFSRCWPHAGSFQFRDDMKVFAQGDEAFVRYETIAKPGGTFRNAEFFTIEAGRIRSIDVYFGFVPGASAASAASGGEQQAVSR
jgi:ketosteroid isomerase-like protein